MMVSQGGVVACLNKEQSQPHALPLLRGHMLHNLTQHNVTQSVHFGDVSLIIVTNDREIGR